VSSSHVLVVEDNELVSTALRLLLESADHRVSTAASVAESIGVASSDAPVLALLDLTLPDGDGLTLVAPLRAAGCKTIVALTGHDDPETRERCLASGCSEVLVKPVPARELLNRIASWLA
jgi:two-component system KDP operon response regulator KdpE